MHSIRDLALLSNAHPCAIRVQFQYNLMSRYVVQEEFSRTPPGGREGPQTRIKTTRGLEGLGNTYGFDMARKESMECWLMQVLYYMFYHEKPFQAQLGVMAFLEAHK